MILRVLLVLLKTGRVGHSSGSPIRSVLLILECENTRVSTRAARCPWNLCEALSFIVKDDLDINDAGLFLS